MQAYTITTGQLAREARVQPATIRAYADRGFLDFIVASNGVRLFKSGQAPKVRQILATRLANRGRKAQR